MAGLLNYLARSLEAKGRNGDTLVAHISPREAMILRLLGGAGTRNPATGLPEFYMSSAGPSGGGTGKADRDAANAGTALGGDRGGNSGRGNENSATGRRAASQRDTTYGGGYGLNGGTSVSRGLSPGALSYASPNAPMSESLAQAQATLDKRVADALNQGNTGWDKFGNFIAHSLGFNEQNPMGVGLGLGASAPNPQTGAPADPRTGWGFDPAGLIGTGLGLATGIQGLGTAADIISSALGRPAEISLGPDVFGSGAPSPFGGGSPSGASSGSQSGSPSGSPAGSPAGSIAQGQGPGSTLEAARRANAATAAQPTSLLASLPASGALVPSAQPMTFPAGLLPYLAQNNGMLPGYRTNSRFGFGSVAPVNYMQYDA
jgi:hypothetical protein